VKRRNDSGGTLSEDEDCIFEEGSCGIVDIGNRYDVDIND
jgi:hypothetical protein